MKLGRKWDGKTIEIQDFGSGQITAALGFSKLASRIVGPFETGVDRPVWSCGGWQGT
jgi:hypothetical protein